MRKIASAESPKSPMMLGPDTRAAEGCTGRASLLDQAISHGAGETTADQVRAMLGLADRGRVLDYSKQSCVAMHRPPWPN